MQETKIYIAATLINQKQSSLQKNLPVYREGKNSPFPTMFTGTANPSWNEGCSFPIDFESSDSMKPIRISVWNDIECVGVTQCEIPLTPISRIYVKRIYDEDYIVRGYVCVRVGFVPFGVQVTDLLNETVMDEYATADMLGLRRKYAEVIAQNYDFQTAIRLLQDKIDELEGLKAQESPDAKRHARNRENQKGPSVKALWHFFAMLSEPWSKATRVSAYKLRCCMEQGSYIIHIR